MATYIRTVDGKLQIEIEPKSPVTMGPNIPTEQAVISAAAAAAEAAEAAEAAAEQAMSGTPEGYAALVASVAETYSSQNTYAAGDYVLHDSALYQALVDIDTAEEWTSGHWQAVTIGNELADLKSALETNINGKYMAFEDGYFNITDVGTTVSTTRSASANYVSGIMPCAAGDVFDVNLDGGGTVSGGGARAYAFLDENYAVLSRAEPNTVTYKQVIAPDTAAYFIGNTKKSRENYYALRGKLLHNQINDVASDLVTLTGEEKHARANALQVKYNGFTDSMNLIDKSTMISAYIAATGNIIPQTSGYYVTDFIPVNGNDIISNSVQSTSVLPYAVYDADFNFLRVVSTTSYEYVSGDAYVRITIREAQYSEARAFYGTTLGNYVPFKLYKESSISSIIKTDVYIGSHEWCDYPDVNSALRDIDDDSATKQYTLHISAGTYPPFSMRWMDDERTIRNDSARWINIKGEDPFTTIFFDNKGNRYLSPCELFTNGVIENITFSVQTDADHFDPAQDQTSCYAMHFDYGSCNMRFVNCRFLCNGGPGAGLGLHPDNTVEFENCRFESYCDGTFGGTGQGAIFVHTFSNTYKAVNQHLRIHNCMAIATEQANGGRFAVITSSHQAYGSEYEFEFQNFGCFGNNGPAVNLADPDEDLLSAYNFNNLPAVLNTVT